MTKSEIFEILKARAKLALKYMNRSDLQRMLSKGVIAHVVAEMRTL